MIPLAPVAVTGAALLVTFQGKYPGDATRNPIRIANESQYEATVTAAGVQLVLDPYTADVLRPAQRVTQIAVTFTVLSSQLTPAPVSQLVVTLAQDGEDFPGTYPMALPRQSSVFSPQYASGSQLPSIVIPGAGGFQLDHRPGAGGQASITVPTGPAGAIQVLEWISAAFFQTGAVAGVANLVVTDEALPVNEFLALPFSVPTTANAIDRQHLPGLSITNSGKVGRLKVFFDGVASASVAEYISIGGHYQ